MKTCECGIRIENHYGNPDKFGRSWWIRCEDLASGNFVPTGAHKYGWSAAQVRQHLREKCGRDPAGTPGGGQ